MPCPAGAIPILFGQVPRFEPSSCDSSERCELLRTTQRVRRVGLRLWQHLLLGQGHREHHSHGPRGQGGGGESKHGQNVTHFLLLDSQVFNFSLTGLTIVLRII